MTAKRPRKSDARQKCPECGAVIDPTSCVVYRVTGQKAKKPNLLFGLYCGSDCLLDAHERGWPLTYGKPK